MIDILVASVWAGPVLWALLYVSDYYLTIACARLYATQDRIVFEGSFEITPLFQRDVDALRPFSFRFLLMLVLNTANICLARLIGGPGSGLVGFYELVLGGMVLTEATVHMRHFRNWYVLGKAAALLNGRLEYPRGVMLRISALETLTFTLLYVAFFALTGRFFFLGGAAACAVLAAQHRRLAKRHDTPAKRTA